MDFNKILLDGGLLAALFILMLLALGRANPRYFLSKKNIPPDIYAAVPPRTREEARKGGLLILPVLLLMLGVPAWSGYTFAAASGAGFGWLLAHIYLVLLFPFFGDLLIVDWLVMNTLTPKWVVYPGTEGFAGYKDYMFHLRAHIRGLFVIAILALLLAGGVWLAF